MNFLSRFFGSRNSARPPSAKAACQTATWPFDQAPDAAAVSTRQVLEDGKDILAVVHYSDDHSWAFLCGTTDDKGDGRVITMRHALEIDDSLRTIADLPAGWMAHRATRESPWQKQSNLENG